MMLDGKKSLAERIVYGALDRIEDQTHRNPVDVFEQAMRNATPMLEVKPRRVGGATYQVPVEIRGERRNSLAMRWLISAAPLAQRARAWSRSWPASCWMPSNNTGRDDQAARRRPSNG